MASQDTLAEPPGCTRIVEAKGDLDNDGVAELVVIYNTPGHGDFGTLRHLCVYKQRGGQWQLWHRNKTVILPSDHGGTWGDPFEKLEVRNGSIIITHFGGSMYKWLYRHVYRYQHNNWYVIGATSDYFIECRWSKTLDYNLSTGKATFTSITEECDNGDNKKVLSKHRSTLVNKRGPRLMDKFTPGENEMTITGEEYPFSY
ncbi:MAG: hypothetical protein V4649_07360 [Bacteroidota bacterium]